MAGLPVFEFQKLCKKRVTMAILSATIPSVVDKRQIAIRLGGGSCHRAMILPR